MSVTKRLLSGYTCNFCPKEFATYREADEHAKYAHPAQAEYHGLITTDAEGIAEEAERPKDIITGPLSRREHIAAQAMSALLGRGEFKAIPVQETDQNSYVAGAARLAVKAADALLKALESP
jgi:hypothetical protein